MRSARLAAASRAAGSATDARGGNAPGQRERYWTSPNTCLNNGWSAVRKHSKVQKRPSRWSPVLLHCRPAGEPVKGGIPAALGARAAGVGYRRYLEFLLRQETRHSAGSVYTIRTGQRYQVFTAEGADGRSWPVIPADRDRRFRFVLTDFRPRRECRSRRRNRGRDVRTAYIGSVIGCAYFFHCSGYQCTNVRSGSCLTCPGSERRKRPKSGCVRHRTEPPCQKATLKCHIRVDAFQH